MPQPYDYTIAGPAPAFQNALATVSAFQQQKAQQERAQQLQAATQSAMADPSPENIAQLHLLFPEMKEQLDAYKSGLDEATKTTMTTAAREAIIAGETGGDVAGVFKRYAEAADNSGNQAMAKQFRDAQRVAEQSPEAAVFTARSLYAGLDNEGYKSVFQRPDPTAMQQDYAFIKDKFGDAAAAEFAQYGRGNIVSVPVGAGQTYVGPAADAPGASRWTEARPQNVKTPPSILKAASGSKVISPADADVVRRSLGPNGGKAFEKWLKDNNIREIKRTGTAPDGRKVYEFTDGTIEYAE